MCLGFTASRRYPQHGDALRTRIGRDLFVKSVRSVPIGTLIEVLVDVEDGLHRGVSEAIGDHLRMLALGDQERHVRVTQGVGAQIVIEASRAERRLPVALDPSGAAERPALGRGEDPCLSPPLRAGRRCATSALGSDQSGLAKLSLCPSGSSRWKYRSPHSASRGAFSGL